MYQKHRTRPAGLTRRFSRLTITIRFLSHVGIDSNLKHSSKEKKKSHTASNRTIYFSARRRLEKGIMYEKTHSQKRFDEPCLLLTSCYFRERHAPGGGIYTFLFSSAFNWTNRTRVQDESLKKKCFVIVLRQSVSIRK